MSRVIARRLLRGKYIASLIFLACLSMAAALWIGPYFTSTRPDYASVAAPVGVNEDTMFLVKPKGTACINKVTIPHNLGRLSLQPFPASTKLGPPLVIEVTARNYAAGTTLPGGYPGGVATLPLTPPTHTEIGMVCVHDIGDAPVDLRGNNEPRGVTRSELVVEGKHLPGVIALVFYKQNDEPLIDELPEVAERAGVLLGGVPAGLVLALAVCCAIGIPLLVLLVLHSTAE